MKRRRRASEAERSAKASSICPSIALSAPPRRPISVVPPSGSTRRERSPAPIAAAVSSMRRSGRRLARDQPEAEQRARLAITRAVTSTSIHLSWSSVVSVSCSGAPRIERRVRERHRLREQAEARAALIGGHRRAPRAAVARRREAPRDARRRRRPRPRRGSCRAAAACRRGRISTYVPGVSTPSRDEPRRCRPGPRRRERSRRRRRRWRRACRRRARRATSAAPCRSRRRRPAGRPPSSTASTSSRRARSDIPRSAAPMRPPLRPPTRH